MTTARTSNGRQMHQNQEQDLGALLDRLPPHAIEAEMSLLGSMIVAGTANLHVIGEVMQGLKGAEDFYKPTHAAIYQALVDLYDRNQSLDNVQLIQTLRDQGLLDDAGGADYLVELAESVPTAENAPYYARIVRDKAKLRRLLSVASNLAREAHESSESADHIIDMAEREIFEIAESRTTDEPTQLIELVKATYELLERGSESGRTITGLDTGFFELNDMLSGLQSGEMVIVAARPSMGKTAFALNIAENLAVSDGKPVAVFSLEMSKQQLAQRLMSSRSGVDAQRMRRNMLDGEEFKKLQLVAEDLYEAPMFIDDTPGLTVLGLRAKARRLAAQRDIQAIFIDYLQLMSSPGAESRQQEVSQISRGLKALGRELDVPVVALSQLNRNPEGRADNRPMLSDLRESGSIEQDADVVMMLHREEYYHKDPEWAVENADKHKLAEVIVVKQRNGPTGTVSLHFDGATTRFGNRARGVEEL